MGNPRETGVMFWKIKRSYILIDIWQIFCKSDFAIHGASTKTQADSKRKVATDEEHSVGVLRSVLSNLHILIR